MTTFSTLTSYNTNAALNALSDAKAKMPSLQEKSRAAAVDFEAVFLNQMMSQMFTGIDGDGPFGGEGSGGVWRSFLTDEYAKSFARSGGIGIADQVYRQLLETQEASSASPAASTLEKHS